MGVYRSDYVVIGLKLDYDEEKKRLGSKGFEALYYGVTDSPYPGLVAIVDGMGGEYVVVGKILATAEDRDGFDFLSLEFGEELNALRATAKDLLAKAGYDVEPKLFVFSHFS